VVVVKVALQDYAYAPLAQEYLYKGWGCGSSGFVLGTNPSTHTQRIFIQLSLGQDKLRLCIRDRDRISSGSWPCAAICFSKNFSNTHTCPCTRPVTLKKVRMKVEEAVPIYAMGSSLTKDV
jgi:hypothetical protein